MIFGTVWVLGLWFQNPPELPRSDHPTAWGSQWQQFSMCKSERTYIKIWMLYIFRQKRSIWVYKKYFVVVRKSKFRTFQNYQKIWDWDWDPMGLGSQCRPVVRTIRQLGGQEDSAFKCWSQKGLISKSECYIFSAKTLDLGL